MSVALRTSVRQAGKLRLRPRLAQGMTPTPNSTGNLRNLSTTSARFNIIHIRNNEEFRQKVINSNRSVIVNFHADWCEPCAVLTPKLRELVEKNKNIDLAILNIEDHYELVAEFEVKAVPAVIAFRDGVVKGKFVGLVDADEIEKLIREVDLPPLNAGDPGYYLVPVAPSLPLAPPVQPTQKASPFWAMVSISGFVLFCYLCISARNRRVARNKKNAKK